MANNSLSGGGGGTGKEGGWKEDQIREARRPVSLTVPTMRNKSPENGGIGRKKGERRGPSERRAWSFGGGPKAAFFVVADRQRMMIQVEVVVSRERGATAAERGRQWCERGDLAWTGA
ncbi:hypothetical protein ACOSQ4_011160 [Xanthoceras sorbifolium]